ncbi:hypothetical protein DA798_11300 [Lactobacillus sp. PFC-70]|nr:hypothetical protein DA798_11300 [Lactobacillus sp. PFC-70]
MYKAYESFGKKPEFEVRENSFKVIFPNRNFSVNKANDELAIDVQETADELVLNVLQHATRDLKRTEIEGKTGLSRSKVFSSLRVLIRDGKVKVIWASVSTKYRSI